MSPWDRQRLGRGDLNPSGFLRIWPCPTVRQENRVIYPNRDRFRQRAPQSFAGGFSRVLCGPIVGVTEVLMKHQKVNRRELKKLWSHTLQRMEPQPDSG